MQQLYPTKLVGTFNKEAATYEEVLEKFLEEALGYYARRKAEIGEEQFHELERLVLLSQIDNRWREHLYEMDYLREGIGLRAYGQRDPQIEYQREAYDMFVGMRESMKDEFVRYMFHVEVARPQETRQTASVREVHSEGGALRQARQSAGVVTGEGPIAGQTVRSDKIPRNAPCPCGSGKKYKKCHGLEA